MGRRSSGGFGSFGGGFRSSGGRSRSSGGGFGSSRSASSTPKPAAAKAASPPARRDEKEKKAPAPTSATTGPQGGLMASIADGFAWGAGSSVGHRIGEAIFGPRTVRVETVVSPAPAPAPTTNSLDYSDSCGAPFNAFIDCVYSNKTDISRCQGVMDKLSACRGDSSHLDNQASPFDGF